VCWGAMVKHTKVSSYAAPCTRSNAEYKEIFFFFFYKSIHKHKAKYLQNTSTPPPNSKCHIVHNVTENTKPRGRVNLGIA
jgi:hypothetical protein